jgi:FkbM family methyltransferase
MIIDIVKFKVIGLIESLKNHLIQIINGNSTLDVVLADLLYRRSNFIIGNFSIKLPDGLRVLVNNRAIINTNIPDHYWRKEYMRHHGYVPRDGWVVFDVGAYVGIYSLWASRLVGDGFVAAFEPNPMAFRWLISNIELNNATNIKALPYALGDKITKQKLYVAGENEGASSLIMNHIIDNPIGRYPIVGEFVVPVATLDYVIDKSTEILGKPIRRIDLVKIDVEGYEMKVLRGAGKALYEGLIDKFVIEVHLDQVNTKDLLKYLADYGYAMDKVVRFGNVKDIVYLKHKR